MSKCDDIHKLELLLHRKKEHIGRWAAKVRQTFRHVACLFLKSAVALHSIVSSIVLCLNEITTIMSNTLNLSLLFLLLIIPQYRNSPVPRMESWMEMDQGDGFVDRDLTSSLTGAESFGSAHKNYQNALIRKKQVDSEGN